MTAAGWFADPSGLWELRWFDGATWSDHVATGSHQATEPYPPHLQPPPEEATVLWSTAGKSEGEPVRLDLTWHTLDFLPLRRLHESRRLPLSIVRGVVTERVAGDGSGNLRVSVGGPGYVGPGVLLVRDAPGVGATRAVILRQRAIATGIPASAS